MTARSRWATAALTVCASRRLEPLCHPKHAVSGEDERAGRPTTSRARSGSLDWSGDASRLVVALGGNENGARARGRAEEAARSRRRADTARGSRVRTEVSDARFARRDPLDAGDGNLRSLEQVDNVPGHQDDSGCRA